VKLEQSFEIAAPIEQVWDALVDIERVAPCLPGASVTGHNEEGSYTGALTIKIGALTAAYAGKLQMENIDEETRSAVMQAQGTDKRGQGGSKATITSNLSPTNNGGTHVNVITDYHITGRLARFGRGGMIDDISERLLREFAQCLQSKLVGGQQAASAPEAAASASADGEGSGGGGETVGTAPSAGRPEDAPPPPPPSPPPRPPPLPQQPAPQAGQPLDAMPLVASVGKDRARDNAAPIGAILFGFLLAFLILRRRRSRH
jgi:uncharacterized protein